MSTKIEWVRNPDGTKGESWNPVSGCSHSGSPGCDHCWARRMAQRLRGRFGYPQDDPFAVTLHPDKLDAPLHWKKPRRIFVCSMGDFFHCLVPFSFQCEILQVIGKCPQHTFLILTKRTDQLEMWEHAAGWHPYPNLWLGVTAENQEQADKRIPVLLQTPAAKRWVSIEPCLGEMDISGALWGYPRQMSYRTYVTHDMAMDAQDMSLEGTLYTDDEWEQTTPALDWVVLGGETGPGARPMHPNWARDVRDQCVAAGVPFLFKQWGAWFPRDQWEHSPELVLPDDDVAYQQGPRTHIFPDGTAAHRIGKKRAGHLLDGQLWDQYPA